MLNQKAKDIAKKSFQAAVVVGIFFFLGTNLYKSWNEVRGMSWEFSYSYLFLCIVAILGVYTITVFNYYYLLRKMGIEAGLKAVTKARIITDIAGYIPGKVWTLLGRFYYLQKHGISKMEISISTLLEFLLMLVSGALFAVIIVLLSGMNQSALDPYYYVLLAAIPVLFVAVHPKIILFAARKLENTLNIPNARINLRYKDIAHIILLYIPYWILSGLTVFFLIRSIYPAPLALLPQVAGIFAISWVISLITLIAPAGLGVREGILSLLLSVYIPLPIAIIASVLLRIIFIIAGTMLALLARKL